MIDAILTNTLLPQISGEFLGRMSEGTATREVAIGVRDNNFQYSFA
jgi:type VI secretion system protein VasG